MARYYFHLFNDVTSIDQEGAELRDLPQAMERATTLARDMAAQSVQEGRLTLHHRIDVSDEGGTTVGTVHFRDAVLICE
jgi:hypothetical protein